MIDNVLNEINPHSLMPAKAAREIADKFGSYKMIKKFNELVYEASSRGQKNTKYEVIRSASYDACKAYQQNETLNFFISECKNRGYNTYFMLNQDDKTDEYFGELIISWDKKK